MYDEYIQIIFICHFGGISFMSQTDRIYLYKNDKVID